MPKKPFQGGQKFWPIFSLGMYQDYSNWSSGQVQHHDPSLGGRGELLHLLESTRLSPLISFLSFQTLIIFENHENQAQWWAANGVLLALSPSLVREFKKKNTWPGLSSSIICINLEYLFNRKTNFPKPVFTRWLSGQRLAIVKISLQYTNQGALGYEMDI